MVKNEKGFTLLEVMLVVVILAILAAIVIPRFVGNAETAREKADITTGREVKAALDRYQVDNGIYLRIDELSAANGTITGSGLIPDYIARLDSTVTQQKAETGKMGFGIAEITGNTFPDPENLIMVYLSSDGSQAEVKVFDKSLASTLWSSI